MRAGTRWRSDALPPRVLARCRPDESWGELSVLLTNDAEMHVLNKQWRGLDKADRCPVLPIR